MKVTLRTVARHLTLSQLVKGEVYVRSDSDGGPAYIHTDNYEFPMLNLHNGNSVLRSSAQTYKWLHVPTAELSS